MEDQKKDKQELPRDPISKRDARKERARITKLVKKWVRHIGLGWWSIDFRYRNEYAKKDNFGYHPQSINDHWEIVMDTSADPWYKKAFVTAYLPMTRELSDHDLEHTFVHELVHIFVSPMSSKKFGKEEELVATTISDALIWARKRGFEEGSKAKKG